MLYNKMKQNQFKKILVDWVKNKNYEETEKLIDINK